MKIFHEKIISKIIYILIVLPFLSFSTTTYTTILYFKTDYTFNGIEHTGENNILKYNYDEGDLAINDQLYKVEISNSFYKDKITLNLLSSNSSDYNIGFLVQIQDKFYEIQDPELTVMVRNNKFDCSIDKTFIQVNETYSKEVKYCKNKNQSSNVEFYMYIPFNIYENCYSACTECSFFGNETNNNCLKCNNSENYYFKEEDNSQNCYTNDTIEEGYFLDEDNSIFKKCSNSCLTCSNFSENCIKCNNNLDYHFDPIIDNHCIKQDELPNINYYLDTIDDKYKICNERCLECSGPNETQCKSCNYSNDYYSKEDDINIICYSLDEIEEGYYLDTNNNIIKQCYNRCLSCNESGTNEENNCVKCKNDEYHFDPYKANHCINRDELPNINYYLDINDDKYKICNERCLECEGPNETQCLSCNNSNGYYSKEDDIYIICYSLDEIEDGYYLDIYNNIIKKCNNRCFSCNKGGSDSNSNCLQCLNNEYHFDPIKSNHCINESELPSISYYLDKSINKYKKCNIACLTCYGPYNNNCILCDNDNGYYYKENNESQICYSQSNIEIGYYLDTINNLFRNCNNRCLSCDKGGSDIQSNCIKCNKNENYHFDPYIDNHCIKEEELPNINYYLDTIDDKYKICLPSCLTCAGPSKCAKCNNTKGYYFIENDNSGICYTQLTIPIGYYLNLTDNLFKLCNNRCYSCIRGGNNFESNCTVCKNSANYHFDPYKLDHCIKQSELPNISFYLETSLDQYKICHESCLTCDGQYNNNCTSCNGVSFFETEFYDKRCLKFEEIPINYYSEYSSGKFVYYKCHISCKTCLVGGVNNCKDCNISGGYYPVSDKPGYCLTENQVPIKYYLDRTEKKIKNCEANCATCSKGFNSLTQEMNCDSCIPNTYFQNTTSTNCIPKPETGFYIDIYNGHETLFPCFPTCLTCDVGGDADINNCLSCRSEYYFDDEEPSNCVDDDLNCAIGCAKCYKNSSDPVYGVLSADKMCRRCSHKMGYYPLEKYSPNQFYVSCYPFNKSPFNYIYDENKKIHTLCYKTCKTCFKVGDNLNHSCSSCETNYIFIDEEQFNCFPKCEFYYYYNKYNQYKCTETSECPLEYPFLISNKSKCVDNCYSDNEFNLMFKNECFQKCPEGTSAYLYKYNGEFTAKCINSDDFLDDKECDLDIKVSKLKYSEITEDILDEYAADYVHSYPVANSYVTSYLSPDSDTMNKYLIVIYKLEKCPKQKVEGFIPIGLDECIDKVKTKFTIMQNIVVEIFYIIRKSTAPQINYYLYHPDTGEKLDLSVCSGAKLAIKTSIFDNGKVDEELVKYFSNLGINIFDIKDPFFTDICFNYNQQGKDVTLEDRIRLYYQNITLCEDGCSYIGVNIETYEVECSCDVKSEDKPIEENNIKNLLDNPISNEVFGVITNSNLEVLKCIKYAFNIKLILKNYGGLSMMGVFLIQVICTIFIKIQTKKVERFIYKFITQIKNPPKRKTHIINFEKNKYNKEINNKNIYNVNNDDIINKASKDIIINSISKNDNIEQNKDEINNKQLKIDIKINKKHKTHKNTNIKYRNPNPKYQLLKQGSLSSTSSLFGTKDKFIFVKKNSLPYTTQYTNITKEQNNSPNKSGSELNLNLNKSNNSSGNDSGSGSGCGDRGSTRNNLVSDSGLNNLEELAEYNYENKHMENSDINKKQFCEERDEGFNTNIDIITNQKKPNKFNTNVTSIKLNKDNNNIIFENEKVIENGMSSGTFRDNIPINELGFEGNKNITIYSRKRKNNFISSIHIKEKKRNSDTHNPHDIIRLKKEIRKEILSKIREEEKEKKEKEQIDKIYMVPYEHKEYDEKQLNELDYEEAVIYDKRSFCNMLWFSLKERHTLINTFCSESNLKPFPMKLLVLIFSLSCYFVINGFLYNEEYVSQKLESKGKSFYEYISDSIERILYTSIVGGVISFIIGILFNTEKKIDSAMNKYNENKILLKGEIAKIYRISKIIILCFIIIQFILMASFTIYIFCFCYVYPNNQLDWFESSLIVIGIIQIFSLFTCFLLTFMKYMGIKFQLEFCFKITAYFEDNV